MQTSRVGTGFVVALVVLMGGCSSSDDDASVGTTTSTASSSTTTTVTASPSSTTEPPQSSSSTASEAADTQAPPAPANVTCSAGGGSMEVRLEWDAPADPTDIVDVRIYLDEGSGFTRIEKLAVASGAVETGTTRWSAVAFPVPPETDVRMAVTVADTAGNESGWNPIDVNYDYTGGPCPA